MAPTLHEAVAIEKFVQSVTIPILLETEKGAGLLATGTLFEIAGYRLLVTARHIFDHVPDLATLSYPENPRRGGLHTFGSLKLFKPIEEHFDVAVLELLEEETIARLKQGWRFLTLSNVALPSATAQDGSFFVSGYPGELTSNVGDWIQGKIVTAYTQRIPETPFDATPPVIPGLDLFFDYHRQATSIAGEEIQTPEMEGISGASIWEITAEVDSVWSPESAVRVVGVQSAFRHSKYMRAKDWRAVTKVLEQIDPSIALQLDSRLAGC